MIVECSVLSLYMCHSHFQFFLKYMYKLKLKLRYLIRCEKGTFFVQLQDVLLDLNIRMLLLQNRM